ncbi:unnamed protein product [Ambrosiozyma monospora]|uniref:Unnamed protein product n=1 Tax=Ambrosiozyma monospora TaxID=43982 RepID=A0ACB5U449_AMBMO|nr:unnamed protein product [Ambrosiozyma monospora]
MEGCNEEIDKIINYKIADSQGHKIPTAADLGLDKKSGIFEEGWQFVYIPTHQNKELMVYVPEEKTLLEGDLFFNLQHAGSKNPNSDLFNEQFEGKDPQTGLWGWVNRQVIISGGYLSGYVGNKIFKDHSAVRKAFDEVEQKWKFEKIIPCHGDTIDRNGSKVWKDSFSFLQ